MQERPVVVGETLGGRALIDRGLQAGDAVVTEGQYRLSSGTRVAEVPSGSRSVQNISEASAGML